jgi:hypothetical protein
MRAGPKAPKAKPRSGIADAVDARLAYDKRKGARTSRKASEAADKLLADLDQVLKSLDKNAGKRA